jgi:hypothetical protein
MFGVGTWSIMRVSSIGGFDRMIFLLIVGTWVLLRLADACGCTNCVECGWTIEYCMFAIGWFKAVVIAGDVWRTG